jgi:hypothetical protein
MPFLFQNLLPFCVILLLAPGLAAAQKSKPDQPFGLTPSWLQMTRKAAYIFVGTVSGVRRIAARTPNDIATTQITFHVDQGIRGVRSGQKLVIREWAGLWDSGERYRNGERVLLFLHRPSKLGLTSPVGGRLGRIAVDQDGRVILDPGRLTDLPSNSGGEERLDGKIRTRDFARAIQRVAKE